MYIRCFICCLFLLINQNIALANESPPSQLARQVVDQLMNVENEKASASIQKLEQKYPDYPVLGFLKLAPLWAKAESSYDETVRRQTLQKGLELLSHYIGQAESNIAKQPGSPEWRLSLGLSQAFKGLAYMRLGEYLDAYHFGRAGRDTLRSLINDNPNSEDAYFVLGFYEYHTGSVPFYLSWLTWLIDLSGDQELGLQYIHRAIKRAPILSPEASRLLLTQTETNQSNACQRKELARKMANQYPNNKQFPWLESEFLKLCSPMLPKNKGRQPSAGVAGDESVTTAAQSSRPDYLRYLYTLGV